LEPIIFLQTRELPAMVLELVVKLPTEEIIMIQVIQVTLEMFNQVIMILVIQDMAMQVTELMINQVLLTIQTTSSMID
jgi:hypothetical protein